MTVHLTSTVKDFKCCISNAVDGTDDNMLWNDGEEDRHVRIVCVCGGCRN